MFSEKIKVVGTAALAAFVGLVMGTQITNPGSLAQMAAVQQLAPHISTTGPLDGQIESNTVAEQVEQPEVFAIRETTDIPGVLYDFSVLYARLDGAVCERRSLEGSIALLTHDRGHGPLTEAMLLSVADEVRQRRTVLKNTEEYLENLLNELDVRTEKVRAIHRDEL